MPGKLEGRRRVEEKGVVSREATGEEMEEGAGEV